LGEYFVVVVEEHFVL